MTDTSHADTLAARVRHLEIRAELSDLVAAYGHHADARDWEGISESFAKEGELSAAGATVTGRTAVKEFLAESLGAYEFTFHYPHAQVFTITDDGRAGGVVTGHAEHGLDGTCLVAAVRYDDEYVREDGRWRIASRTVTPRYLLGWPEFAGSFREGAVSERLAASP